MRYKRSRSQARSRESMACTRMTPIRPPLGAAIRCGVADTANHRRQVHQPPPPVHGARISRHSRPPAHLPFTATRCKSPLLQPNAFSPDVLGCAHHHAHRTGAHGRGTFQTHRLERGEARRARQARRGHGSALVDVNVDPPQVWCCGRASHRAAGTRPRPARQRHLPRQWIQCVCAPHRASFVSRVRALACSKVCASLTTPLFLVAHLVRALP